MEFGLLHLCKSIQVKSLYAFLRKEGWGGSWAALCSSPLLSGRTPLRRKLLQPFLFPPPQPPYTGATRHTQPTLRCKPVTPLTNPLPYNGATCHSAYEAKKAFTTLPLSNLLTEDYLRGITLPAAKEGQAILGFFQNLSWNIFAYENILFFWGPRNPLEGTSSVLFISEEFNFDILF